MKLIRRSLPILTCLVAVVMAHAQDSGLAGSVRYVRLGTDRIVVFSKGVALDFQRDAAWDISDSKQKTLFDSWMSKAGQSKDPGRFIASLAPEKEVPVAGEIILDPPGNDTVALSLKFKETTPVPMTLTHKSGWALGSSDRDSFKEFAEKLHTTTPTLLVALSGASKVSEEQAWEKLVDRARSTSGYVTLIGGSKLAIWSHLKEGASTPVSAPETTDKPKPSSEAAPVPASSGGSTSWLFPALGVGIVGLVGVVFGVPGVRAKVLGSGSKSVATKEAAFPVGTHERELILKVRDEGQRKPPPLNAPYSVEEYAVGMMLDRYQSYETLVRERDLAQKKADSLQAYKEYQEQHEAFEKRYVAATEALKKAQAELTKERETRKDLQDKIQQAETYVNKLLQDQAALAQSLGDAEALIQETGEWSKAVTDRLNAQAAKIHHE